MAALAGGEVISAVATVITAGFTRTEIAKLYKNKPLQGMETPCAFIDMINGEHTNEMTGRGSRSYIIDVRVHPLDTNTTKEAWAQTIAEKMVSVINKITVSTQKVKASKISWNFTDDVLHVIASYTFKVIEVATADPEFMDTVTITERIK